MPLSLIAESYGVVATSYWIAAELEWKNIESRDPSQIASSTQDENPGLLGQLGLGITLAKRLPRRVESSILSESSIINELGLTDDAFRPKSYTVRIEQGNFIEPCYIGCPSLDRPRFALRLLFDKSPYPPRSEWRKPENGPDDSQFWHHKEFVSRSFWDPKKQERPENDISAWTRNNCLVL